MTVKALSLTRPWTALVLRHGKDIENRSWETAHRGLLVIHGALSWDPRAFELALRIELAGGYGDLDLPALSPLEADHPSGYLGVVRIDDVCTAGRGDPTLAGCLCGPWAMPDQCHWRISRPVLFDEPIRGGGRLSLWTPPAEVLAAVDALGVAP